MAAEWEERFWAKVAVAGPDDCWEWTAVRHQGYGRFMTVRGKVSAGAHRLAYQLTRGPIPEGLEIDHLCRNRGCVNPNHLEAVTHAENNRRSSEWLARNRSRCRSGRHPWTNVYRSPAGGQTCRLCRNDFKRRWRRAKAAA